MQLVACLVTAGVNFASAADTVHYPPQQEDICSVDTHIVDKDALATYLIKKFPVSILAVEPIKDCKTSLARQLLASEVLLDPKKCITCSSADQESLKKIDGFMASLLAGLLRSSYSPSNTVDLHTNEYFRGNNEENAIKCVIVDGQPVEPPGNSVLSDTPKSKIRIRGTASDLSIERTDKQNFAGASKAIFDLGRDNVAKKETEKIVADVGYLIHTSDLGAGDRRDIIPYVGTNYNVINVNPGSNTKPSASKTVDFGILLNTYLISNRGPSPFGHLVTIQPDYLFNFADNSRLFTGNVIYIPIINNRLNSFMPIASDIASFEIIIKLKNDNGIYTDRGNPSVTSSHKNFVRIGGQFGVSFVSDNKNVPLSLTSTYTRLQPISGVTEIRYISNSLTYSFDPNKYFGISLNNTNGTREDTAVYESQWELAFSAHF